MRLGGLDSEQIIVIKTLSKLDIAGVTWQKTSSLMNNLVQIKENRNL